MPPATSPGSGRDSKYRRLGIYGDQLTGCRRRTPIPPVLRRSVTGEETSRPLAVIGLIKHVGDPGGVLACDREIEGLADRSERLTCPAYLSVLQYSCVELAWTQSSRRHRIGRAHARHVINTVEPSAITTADGSEGLLWVGPDDRGLELEVIAVALPKWYLVIHVMPTALRGGPS